MGESEYYKYYEILFSLRKEYLKNQEIINKLLSHVSISDDLFRDYSPNVIFERDNKNNTDYLLLVVSKRQSFIRLLFNSLYDSIVMSDPILEHGKYLYVFRFTNDFVYLLDGNQDGRYLDSTISINNPKEFIELYKLLMKNVICKNGSTYITSGDAFFKLSNNGIHLLYSQNNNQRKNIVLDYDGIGDHLRTNNTSCMKSLMELKINKGDIPANFRELIDGNMGNYSYTAFKQEKNKMGYYEIENHNKKLILKKKKCT